MQQPGMKQAVQTVLILAMTFAVAPASVSAESSGEAAAWPRFGGPSGNFQVMDGVLPKAWPKEGPKVLWDRELGPGYSTIAATTDMLYTMFLDGDEDVVIAMRVSDGSTAWSHRYPNVPREENLVQFGRGPHATPLVVGDRLYTLGYTGIFKAFDRESGKVLWSHDLLEDFGADVLPWGFSASPIHHEGRLIVLVGGSKQGAVALAEDTGFVVWKSPPTSVSYASPIVIEVDGREQLLYFGHDALHAIDPTSGQALWSHPVKNGYENNSTMPLWASDDLLWVATQQDGGTRVLRLTATGADQPGKPETQVEQVWFNDKIKIHFWNSIRLGDTVYGSIGDRVSTLAGVDIKTGKVLWRQRGFSKANLIHTPSGTVALDEKGQLSLLGLSRDGVEVRAQYALGEGTYWSAPTLVKSRLYGRNKQRVRALDLAPSAEVEAPEAKAP